MACGNLRSYSRPTDSLRHLHTSLALRKTQLMDIGVTIGRAVLYQNEPAIPILIAHSTGLGYKLNSANILFTFFSISR